MSGATPSFTAFEGSRRIASGPLGAVAERVKVRHDAGGPDPLVFDDQTGRVVDLDLRGSLDDVLARLPLLPAESAEVPRPGRGRPKLGVVAREVTLLPRHWAWLAEQPGGASVTLRRLVEHARQATAGRDRQRRAQEVAYRFMQAMAGDAPGFEEATRALFAGNRVRFDACTGAWPVDIGDHARRLAADAFVVEAGDA